MFQNTFKRHPKHIFSRDIFFEKHFFFKIRVLNFTTIEFLNKLFLRLRDLFVQKLVLELFFLIKSLVVVLVLFAGKPSPKHCFS